MNLSTISQRLEHILQRRFANTGSGAPRKIDDPELAEALEELGVAFEELRVAGEELGVQEEQISALRSTLASERDRYHDLFEFAPDGYILTDPRGMIGEANLAAAAMLGVDREYLIGRPLATYVSSESRRHFRRELAVMMAKEGIYRFELPFHRRDGSMFTGAVRVRPACDRNGRIVAYRWLLREADGATASPREHGRQGNGGMFRALVEYSPDAVAVVGSDGSVIYTNPASTTILGIDPVDAAGQNIFASLHPRDRKPAVELFRNVLASPGAAVTAELRVRHADRSWTPLAITAVNCVDCPDIAAILVYYRAL